MKKNDIYKVAIAILAIVAALVFVLVTASILAPPKRSSKANKVDFECITEPRAKPLQECKK